MATLSTTNLNWLAGKWEDSYSSAVLSGIVGDLAHKARGGYHISRQDQPSGNYSVIRPDDKPGNGPSDRAAAIDMTMSTADIIKCHKRLREIWKNRADDPRMKYINAWNGWDGEGDAGRYDVVKGTIDTATSDHKWHIHLEIRRKYVNDMSAMEAILSMLRGESLTVYRGESATPVPPQQTEEDEDMNLDDNLYPGTASESWTNRYGNTPATVRNAIAFAAFDANDAEKLAGAVNTKVDALASVVASIATRVDLDPAEIAALRAALAVPTAGENADAVVDALGGLNPDQLADILTGILGADKAAALKAAL